MVYDERKREEWAVSQANQVRQTVAHLYTYSLHHSDRGRKKRSPLWPGDFRQNKKGLE